MLKDFFFWLKIAALFLVRSGRSTAALSLMVVTAVGALIFLSALAVGVNDAMIGNSVSLYSGHITGFDLPPALQPETLAVQGVSAVVKRVPVPGVLAGAGHFETVVMLGTDPAVEKKTTAFWKKTVRGGFLSCAQPGVFISQPLAEALAVTAGDTVRFSPGGMEHFTAFTVEGIYKTGIDQLDRGIAFCCLSALPDQNRPWSASVFLESGTKPESVLARYARDIPGPAAFKSWSELMPDLRQLTDLSYVSMSIVTVLVFGVVSIGIACAFVIFIMKHLREFGIMKVMGVTAGELAGLIFCEIVLINIAASLAGCLLGIAAVLLVGTTGIDLTAFTSHNRYFVVSGIIYPRLTLFSLWSPPALALVFSLAAAIWPALLAARKKAADILRAG